MYAIVDTGSNFSSIPGNISRWCGDQVVTGGKANVHGFNGTTASSFAIPREMQVGDTKFICPVATNSSNPTDPPILGLLSFVSFHKVVFDFAGGAIYYPKTAVPMSGLNELLYFNGLQISSSGTLEGIPSWDLKPHIDIPAKQITSLFDLPFTPSEAFFKNWKTYANYVLSMANLVFQKHNLKVVYGNPSKSLTLRPSTKFFVTTDIGPPPTTEEDRVPGVYLIRCRQTSDGDFRWGRSPHPCANGESRRIYFRRLASWNRSPIFGLRLAGWTQFLPENIGRANEFCKLSLPHLRR
jgi:hypothetical protein